MSEPSKNKNSLSTSAVSNAFANEMEDELDQIYHNFISRGTFELPISSKFFNHFVFIDCIYFSAQKKQEKKTVILNEQDENDSDDEDDEPSKKLIR